MPGLASPKHKVADRWYAVLQAWVLRKGQGRNQRRTFLPYLFQGIGGFLSICLRTWGTGAESAVSDSYPGRAAPAVAAAASPGPHRLPTRAGRARVPVGVRHELVSICAHPSFRQVPSRGARGRTRSTSRRCRHRRRRCRSSSGSSCCRCRSCCRLGFQARAGPSSATRRRGWCRPSRWHSLRSRRARRRGDGWDHRQQWEQGCLGMHKMVPDVRWQATSVQGGVDPPLGVDQLCDPRLLLGGGAAGATA